MHRILTKGTLALAAALFVCPAFAQLPNLFPEEKQYSAQALQIVGQVSVLKGREPWVLNQGDWVQKRQEIVTGGNGYALFQVNDGNGAGLAGKNVKLTPTTTVGGLTVDASVSLHEKDPTVGPRKNGYDLAANYATGPVHLGAGFSKVGDNWQAALRGLYTFGQVTLGAYYQRNKDDNQITGTGAGSRNNFRLSAMYTMGASEFHANVGHANKWSHIADSAATQWTLGYNYNLSKRTKLYGFFTKTDYNGVGVNDFSSLAAGIRHNF